MSQDNIQVKSLKQTVKSFKIFNLILLVFAICYDVFYVLGFVWTLFRYYNRTEITIYSAFFLLNLSNTVAIVAILLGLYKRKSYYVKFYLGLNSCTLFLEVVLLIFVFGFQENVWRPNMENLFSTIFVLVYELIFIGANCFVCLLVRMYSKNDLGQFSFEKRSISSSETSLVKKELNSTVSLLNDEVNMFIDTLDTLRKQLDDRAGLERRY